MSNAENLRKIFQDVQVSGKFEKYDSGRIESSDRYSRPLGESGACLCDRCLRRIFEPIKEGARHEWEMVA
jgi:hypothetical protein